MSVNKKNEVHKNDVLIFAMMITFFFFFFFLNQVEKTSLEGKIFPYLESRIFSAPGLKPSVSVNKPVNRIFSAQRWSGQFISSVLPGYDRFPSKKNRHLVGSGRSEGSL